MDGPASRYGEISLNALLMRREGALLAVTISTTG
jgi:hypothetical protein